MDRAVTALPAQRGQDAEPVLWVSEVFGPTVQGEGPSLGRRARFVRLMGCNLHCGWCDTPYTWDATRFRLAAEGHPMTVSAVMAEVVGSRGGRAGLVVITGGEPLLHQHRPPFLHLLAALRRAGLEVEVETNGTQAPEQAVTELVDRFNVSPKLGHADEGRDPAERRFVPQALEALAAGGKAVFKFVARQPGDLAEIGALVRRFGIAPDLVWVMPEGTTPEQVAAGTALLAAPVIAAGYNLTTRLHVIAWGDLRGR
jgi:7-carboxy-7-deazaguanine synthase